MEFEYYNESGSDAPGPEPVQQAITTTLTGESRQASGITVVLVTNDILRSMKAEHFGIDAYTDTIAFNLNDPDELEIEGEMYLSPEQIRLNAGDYDVSYEQEFFRVVIHGCLHLCGYEDATESEKSQMRSLEDKYLTELDLL